jgi:hypothetical protein
LYFFRRLHCFHLYYEWSFVANQYNPGIFQY